MACASVWPVGALSGIIALVLGAIVGLTAAYFGGRIEAAIMRLVDLQLSFPAILVALMLLAILGKGVDKIIIALVIVQWAYYARTVRASALVERRTGVYRGGQSAGPLFLAHPAAPPAAERATRR